MHSLMSLATLSDTELLSEIARLATCERQATAHLIASLAEVDARRLYLGVGCSSLFTYCTQVLHLSEHAAYGRIEAARIARRFPVILERLADGSTTLTAICLLSSHLTTNNHQELLDAARNKSKRDIEHLVAQLRPRPDVKPTVRKLPQGKLRQEVRDAYKTAPDPPAGAPDPLPPAEAGERNPKPAESLRAVAVRTPTDRPQIAPLAPERYKVQFTISRETHEKLRRVQDLLRHSIPNGDPAAIFDQALTLLLEQVARTKLAATQRPRPGKVVASASRHIPAGIKRAVWQRDGGRCAFVGTSGRCEATGFLEFHHVRPYADGGDTRVENMELRCRAHNAYEAEQYFGSLLLREAQPTFDCRRQLGPDRVHDVRGLKGRGVRVRRVVAEVRAA